MSFPGLLFLMDFFFVSFFSFLAVLCFAMVLGASFSICIFLSGFVCLVFLSYVGNGGFNGGGREGINE